MKNFCIKISGVTLRAFILAPLCLAMAVTARADTVVGPAKRQTTLAQGKDLLSEKSVSLSTKNPFTPEGFGQGEPIQGPIAPVLSGPRSNRELLQAIGASLRPSGFFVVSGEPTLVFGQKRVKAGGTLTITFEGNEYTLEIVSIERPNFTLRLNREEFTRPIK